MKAVVYSGPSVFEIADVPIPVPGPGQVLVKMEQTGVCGTDLHLHEGEFDAVFPMTPGHETVGRVDGELVTVNPNKPCGRCDYCRSGRPVLCADGTGLGSSRPGFFAEYAVADEDQIFSVEGLDLDTATLVEPTACAMHGIETLQIRPGATALVIGAGPTGLLLAQLMASSGASSVTVADRIPFKLETATRLGIDSVIDASGGAPGYDPSGYDIVVEATGLPSVGATCVALTRRGGTVLLYGVMRAADTVPIHPYDLFRREITVKGSYAEMTSFGAAIAALRSGRASGAGLITHRFPLSDYGRALSTLRSDPAAHKVVVTF
jgi:D-arabinitol dehydrogenase (NADP+)